MKNQRDLLGDFYQRHLDEFESVVGYVDDGHTGTDANRENFQRLLTDVMSGKINCVIVKDLSRFARNLVRPLSLIQETACFLRTTGRYHTQGTDCWNARLRVRESKKKADPAKIFMLWGLPSSGKTEKAAQLMLEYQQTGKIYQGAENLFTINDALRACAFILDKKQVMDSLQKIPGYEQSVTVISVDSIRKEMEIHRIFLKVQEGFFGNCKKGRYPRYGNQRDTRTAAFPCKKR